MCLNDSLSEAKALHMYLSIFYVRLKLKLYSRVIILALYDPVIYGEESYGDAVLVEMAC